MAYNDRVKCCHTRQVMSPLTHAFIPKGTVWQHRSAAVRGLFAFLDRTPRVSRGRKWGRSEENRDTVRPEGPVQFRNNPWGWPHHQAWGLGNKHGDPLRRGEFLLYSFVGRGGLWVNSHSLTSMGQE